MHPSDYYTQYLHLRAAGKYFESAENLVIYLIRQKLKCDIIDELLIAYLNDSSKDLYNNYLVISQSIDCYNKSLYKEAVAKLELIEPISELVLLEKDYLTSYFIYDGCIFERNVEACDSLVYSFDNILDNNFDMWLRSGLLLYIFHINRLHNGIAARNVERKIMKEIAKRYQDDSSLEIIVHILNRNASALYSVEVALQKNQKCVDYFTMHAHTLPLEYIYALTYYSGLLLIASEYEKGFLYAKKAVTFISEKNVWVKDFGKIINNYLINGVMAKRINYNEAVDICILLMNDSISYKSILFKSNYYIFRALSGYYDGLLEEIETLFWSDKVQKHNDYYIYLIGINCICISIVMGDFDVAKEIYNALNEMVPAICSNEEYIIKMRYKLFEDIIVNKNIIFTKLESLEDYFFQKLVNINSDYARKPYILTDQQFWSVI